MAQQQREICEITACTAWHAACRMHSRPLPPPRPGVPSCTSLAPCSRRSPSSRRRRFPSLPASRPPDKAARSIPIAHTASIARSSAAPLVRRPLARRASSVRRRHPAKRRSSKNACPAPAWRTATAPTEWSATRSRPRLARHRQERPLVLPTPSATRHRTRRRIARRRPPTAASRATTCRARPTRVAEMGSRAFRIRPRARAGAVAP